jgi:hypothetical protein
VVPAELLNPLAPSAMYDRPYEPGISTPVSVKVLPRSIVMSS